jgi:hypothetical protein
VEHDSVFTQTPHGGRNLPLLGAGVLPGLIGHLPLPSRLKAGLRSGNTIFAQMKGRGINHVFVESHYFAVIGGSGRVDDLAILRMNLNVRLDVGLLLYHRHFGCCRFGPLHLEDIDGPLSRIKPAIDWQMKANAGVLKEQLECQSGQGE